MIIGLTGGIGSGKTTVAKLFETMGCAIYNSDDRAKELYFNPIIKQAVIELLGTEAYLSETVINKDFISKKVFSDTKLLHQLNDIIHPAVKADFIQFKSKFPLNTIIIKESALLFETGIYKDLNFNILITAPVDLKIERVMRRNSVSKNEIEKRMQAQWTDEQKTPLANAVITNDNRTALIPQVISIIETLKNA
ncbi:MAG: dephospho-CoA kinase [Sphingobacteriaceae bacterium]|nr:dephospho-CoA kinase [Sphingobacteriaceae bacterium]